MTDIKDKKEGNNKRYTSTLSTTQMEDLCIRHIPQFTTCQKKMI